MSKTVRFNATVLMGHMEVAAQINNLKMMSTSADENGTTFANAGFEDMIPGIFSSTTELSGFYDADSVSSDPDGTLFNRRDPILVGVTETRPVAAADRIHFTLFRQFDYTVGFTVGKLASLSSTGKGVELWRGKVLSAGAISASAATAGQNIGATLSTKRVALGVWAVAKSGTPTLSLAIESAPTNVWSGGQTVRATFAGLQTMPRWNFTTIHGPITDPWWRTNGTFGGSGTITVYTAIAIL